MALKTSSYLTTYEKVKDREDRKVIFPLPNNPFTAFNRRESSSLLSSEIKCGGPAQNEIALMAKNKITKVTKSKVLEEDFLDDKGYEQLAKYGMLGLTNKELGLMYSCTESTISSKRKKDLRFDKALIEGRLEADGVVLRSLFKRATGTKVIEVTEEWTEINQGTKKEPSMVPIRITKRVTKELPPDTAACTFFLLNRRREHFKRNWPDDFIPPPNPDSIAKAMDAATTPSRTEPSDDGGKEV